MKAVNPVIGFFLGDATCAVAPESALWNAALPTDRTSGPGDTGDVSVGDYFLAAERFFRDDDFQTVRNAAACLLKTPVLSEDIRDIDVCLVKHGRFYHPSKVSVRLHDGRSMSLALNMAFSPEGNDTVSRECAALNMLQDRVEGVPAVFGKKSGERLFGRIHSAFCVPWFEGFHEFHLTTDPEGNQRTVLWDTDRGNRYLSEDEVFSLYRGVARILTDSYNLFTCEQIQPWHHAAGDFVFGTANGTPAVRLITVRQYTSLFQVCPESPGELAEAALIFLAGLAIRTRLDRADGVGEILWARSTAVQATIQGFFESLAVKAGKSGDAETLVLVIQAMAGQLDETDLFDYSQMIIDSYNPLSPEVAIVRQNLKAHAEECFRALRAMNF